MPPEESPDELAARLHDRVLVAGAVSKDLRQAALALGAGGAGPVSSPVEVLAQQVGEASYRVTAAQVEAVRHAAGSEKAAFEVVMSASIGAGLRRWDAAVRAIEEAGNASS